jgi:hypothetical protein
LSSRVVTLQTASSLPRGSRVWFHTRPLRVSDSRLVQSAPPTLLQPPPETPRPCHAASRTPPASHPPVYCPPAHWCPNRPAPFSQPIAATPPKNPSASKVACAAVKPAVVHPSPNRFSLAALSWSRACPTGFSSWPRLCRIETAPGLVLCRLMRWRSAPASRAR